MQSKAATVAAYLAELPADRKAALTRIRELIRKTAPESREEMQGMPAYTVGGEMLCAFASQSNYMALYVCDTAVVEKHRKALKKLSVGKSCIRFKSLDDLPLNVAATILEEAYKRAERGEGSSGE